MASCKPTLTELRLLDQHRNFATTDEDLADISEFLDGALKAFHFVEEAEVVANPIWQDANPRTPGHQPTKTENKYNQWCWKCSVKGFKEGVLLNKRVAIKDSIMVAGMPMSAGSHVLDGYIPECDATVVARILKEGGQIIGKTSVEDLCLSGTSFTGCQGPIQNPWRPDKLFSAGGSSGGSAVAVAIGETDMALGGDQGGSIRIPASNCGIVGLKPTYGLVPYTGALPLSSGIDHLGPMARTVGECAVLLHAIAGFDDNRDHRQPSNGFDTEDFGKIASLMPNVSGCRIGVLKEGFCPCDAEIIRAVNNAVELIRSTGTCNVEEISISEHDKASTVANVLTTLSFTQGFNGQGYSPGDHGVLSSSLSEHLRNGFKSNGHLLPVSTRAYALFHDYYTEKYGRSAFAKASTMLHAIRQAYDRALAQYDVLLLPTLTRLPAEYPQAPTAKERMRINFDMARNTQPFNATHHPALSLNCGYSSEGLPIGLMLVGRHWHDYQLLEVAKAVEAALKPIQRPWPQ